MPHLTTESISAAAEFPDDADTIEVPVFAVRYRGKVQVGISGCQGMFTMGTETVREVCDAFREEFDLRRVTTSTTDIGAVTVTEDGEVVETDVYDEALDE